MTPHQTRILAALLELERRYARHWWTRDALGYVVDAGGYHQTIQKRTMLALSGASLVLLEVESWPKETRRLVTCNCAAYRWGLTDAGRLMAETAPIRWTEDAQRRFASVFAYRCDDQGEGQTRDGDRFVSSLLEDDEDDDGPTGSTEFWKR